jgi:hypothetical protein
MCARDKMLPRALTRVCSAILRLSAILGRRARCAVATKPPAIPARTIFAGLALLTLASCASETLPPALTSDQLKIVAATHFRATVGVRRYTYPVYSDHLIVQLRKTGLFDEVSPLESLQTPPTFVARVDRRIYGTATLPLFTLISAGIIPTTVDEQHGLDFSLIPSARPRKPIAIRFSYKGPSTLGWWAFYRALQPNETLGRADQRTRFVQSLAWHIAQHEHEIAPFAPRI